MSVSILNNIAAMTASRQLGLTSMGMKKTLERLTTGKQINNASDDAAGLATATTLQASALIAGQTAKLETQNYYAAAAKDGYLQEATNLIMRNTELASSGNGSSTEMGVVSGLALAAATKAGITLTAITDAATAKTALDAVNVARGTIAGDMATAQSNANLAGITQENLTAQYSNIMDANVGQEVVNLTKYQILSQAGTSALQQANQSSQYVLGLFR